VAHRVRCHDQAANDRPFGELEAVLSAGVGRPNDRDDVALPHCIGSHNQLRLKQSLSQEIGPLIRGRSAGRIEGEIERVLDPVRDECGIAVEGVLPEQLAHDLAATNQKRVPGIAQAGFNLTRKVYE
jgi:hypothetical protein